MVAGVDTTDPLVLEGLESGASAQVTANIFVDLVPTAIPRVLLQGVETEPQMLHAGQVGVEEVVVDGVAGQDSHAGAVILVVDGVGHVDGLEEFAPGLDRVALQGLAAADGPP